MEVALLNHGAVWGDAALRGQCRPADVGENGADHLESRVWSPDADVHALPELTFHVRYKLCSVIINKN